MIEFKPYLHYGKDIEEAILGACMLEKLAFGRIFNVLKPEHFYKNGNRLVFEALLEMFNNSVPIDIFTVTEWLITKKSVTEIGGDNVPYFVSRLTNHVVSSANIEYHSFLIREMWQRREVLKIKYSKTDEVNPKLAAEEMSKKIREVLDWEHKKDWVDMSEVVYGLIQHQHDMFTGKKSFITTGFKKLDKINGGFYNGQMIVIGARPSVGKSALMGKMAIEMAKSKKKVGIISLEMNNTEIAARLSSLDTDIEFGRIYRDIMADENLHRRFYDKVSQSLINLPIFISDTTKVNVSDIKAKVIKLKAKHGCDVIFIDYLQLIDTINGNKQYNREQEVAQMSRGIKLMAMELDIPVIILCQLNRAVTGRSYKDRFPKLSDLRESGAIEQDADVVMFIHRDYMSGWQVDEGGNSTEYTADLLGPKWRNGGTFHMELDFNPPKMQFNERNESGFIPINYLEEKENGNPF